MTSRREAETGFRARCFTALFSMVLGACASLPQDQPVYEQLDADTGVTIARIGKPVELYREAVPSVYTDRFAFLAPFETNQMGKRESFLWLAVPIDASLAETAPTLDVDGTVLALGTAGREPGFAGLAKPPYKATTTWSVSYYFKIDDELVARLGSANALAIHMMEPTKKGPVEVLFEFKVGEDTRLKEFAARAN